MTSFFGQVTIRYLQKAFHRERRKMKSTLTSEYTQQV